VLRGGGTEALLTLSEASGIRCFASTARELYREKFYPRMIGRLSKAHDLARRPSGISRLAWQARANGQRGIPGSGVSAHYGRCASAVGPHGMTAEAGQHFAPPGVAEWAAGAGNLQALGFTWCRWMGAVRIWRGLGSGGLVVGGLRRRWLGTYGPRRFLLRPDGFVAWGWCDQPSAPNLVLAFANHTLRAAPDLGWKRRRPPGGRSRALPACRAVPSINPLASYTSPRGASPRLIPVGSSIIAS